MSGGEIVVLLMVVWLACGLSGAGWAYAYHQREYPKDAAGMRRMDTSMATLMMFFGPVGSFLMFFLTGFAEHGWLLPGSIPPEAKEKEVKR